MGEAAGRAGIASIASLGLGVFSSISKGLGQQSAYDFQAQRAERAAKFGRLQAGLTDVTFRERLNNTLAHIDTMRAAARIDPTSPTTAAVKDYQEKVSDRQRMAAVMTQRSQAAEDEASARYLHEAGDFALFTNYLDAGTKLFGGLGKAVTA